MTNVSSDRVGVGSNLHGLWLTFAYPSVNNLCDHICRFNIPKEQEKESGDVDDKIY